MEMGMGMAEVMVMVIVNVATSRGSLTSYLCKL